MKIILLLVFTVSLFFQCAPKKQSETYTIIRNLANETLSSYKSVLVIPGEGCNGCIGSATLFVKSNLYKMDSTLIIFTSITDMKMLKIELGGDIFKRRNVKIDLNNSLRKSQLTSIYPMIGRFINDDINNVEVFNGKDF